MKTMTIICKAVRSLLCMFVLVVAVGCEQRELCYDHSHGAILDIVFDWILEPDAQPSTMVVWAFPENGGTGIRAEFSDIRKDATYQMKVPPGKYYMVCYNGDTEFNRERGHTFNDIVLTTNEMSLLDPLNRADESAPRPPLTEWQLVRNQASHVYMDPREIKIEIIESAVHEHNQNVVCHTVNFIPQRVTSIWNIRIEDIQNFTPDLNASAIVTGVAEQLIVSKALPGGDDATIPFGLTACDEGCLKASIVIFGDAAPHDVKHYLRVYTASKYYYTYDITEQVHNAPDPRNVDVIVRGMKLPAGGSGMSPGVSDWDDSEKIEVPF